MTQPETPDEAQDQELQKIILLSVSVQQLSEEARALRETISSGRSQRDTKAMLFLLAVIAVALVGVFLNTVL